MARINYLQSNFTAGELSKEIIGRTDIAKYFNGAETLENVILKSYGGAKGRPGSYYVQSVKTSTAKTRLIPFEFSTTQAYILEFGNQYMRVFKDGAYVTGSEIVTPYLTADLFELQYAQDADTMYIVHNDYAPRKLTRTAHDTWTITEIDYTVEPLRAPLMDANSATDTITPSADSGAGIDLVASVDTFTADHVGSIWKVKDGYAEIKTYTDAQNVTADVLYSGDLNTGPGATTSWAEAAWSDENGYPSCVCFYEERLYMAASTEEPQAFWGSYIGEYENFAEGATDSDAVRYVIASQKVNVIQWILAAKALIMGTTGGNFVISSGTANEPISPTNIQVKPEAGYGSDLILPHRIGHYVYYMQRNSRTVREFSYDYASDSYVALDMTLLANHITTSGITQMDYQEAPDNILWCVRDDGEIATMTRQIDQQVIGWSRQIMGGSYGGGNAVVESVAVIPNGAEDQVWMIVKRTIGGSTTRYIEYLTPFILPTEQEDIFCVDSGLTLDSPITITDITQADPAVVTTDGAHGLSNGDRVRLTNVKGMTEVNQNYYLVANKNAADFELTDVNGNDIDSQEYTAYISGGEARKCVDSVAGLNHLNGEVVAITADGAAHPNRTVSAGSVSLDDSYARVHVGLPYTPKIKGLRIEAGSPIGGVGQGLLGRIIRATVRMYRTLGCEIGIEGGNMETVYFRDNSYLNRAPMLYTGDKTQTFPAEWKRPPQYYIEQTQPLPFHILSVILYYELSDI